MMPPLPDRDPRDQRVADRHPDIVQDELIHVDPVPEPEPAQGGLW